MTRPTGYGGGKEMWWGRKWVTFFVDDLTIAS